MADHLDHTSSSRSGDIDNEMLSGYLKGELSPEAKHRLEEAMIDSPGLNDAVEGLEAIRDMHRVTSLQTEIERDLRLHLAKRKKQGRRHSIKGMGWILIVTIILLLLLVVSFAIIFMRGG